MRSDFCIFILTHGRPEKVYTWDTLKNCGNEYPVFLIVDDEDKTKEEYEKIYPGRVIVFSKLDEASRLDTPDLSNDRRTIVYARNACFSIAKKLGFRFFLELDDDYLSFDFRFAEDGHLGGKKISDFNEVCDAFIDFLIESNAKTVCFAQSGDFIGGLEAKGGGAWRKKVLRKAMNSFFCDTNNDFRFLGRINEDVNTYTSESIKGNIFFTITDVALNQKPTQKNAGGMTEIYLDNGTFLKSFYSVVFSPSCVVVAPMEGNTYHRIHHRVDWGACAPQIISEHYKKRSEMNAE